MPENRRLKLCPHCEGRVELDAVSCQYCGRNITELIFPEEEESSMQKVARDPQSASLEQAISSLYPPPYHSSIPDEEEEESEYVEESRLKPEKKKLSFSMSQEDLVTLISLLMGVQLFVISMLLLFFSTAGEFHIVVQAKRWLLFFFVSLPFLYLAYKKLRSSSLKE